jgi:hypothetical protein
MDRVKVRVNDWVDRFYLPDFPGQYVSGGSVIELDVIEADRQVKANNVRLLDDLEAKYLESKLAGENRELAEKDLLIRNLMKEVNELKKKRDLELENVELKSELSKLKRDKEGKK